MSAPSQARAPAVEVTLRLATAADAPEIVELIKLCLGETNPPWSLAYWRWKHERSPFGASPCLLAIAEDRIVGLRVFSRWTWQHDERFVRAVRAVDTATHPEWRGRKIFNRLTLALAEQMRDEGVAFVFNTPNAASRPGYLKMGWSSLGRTSLWIKPLRPIRLLRESWAARAHGGLSAAADSEDQPLPSGIAPAAELLDQRDLQSLLSSMAVDGRFTTPRTVDYLRWRYADVPAVQYGGAWCFEGRGYAAVCMRMKSRGPVLELRICDLLVGGRSAVTVASTLVRDVIRDSGADVVTAMAARSTPESRVLVAAGFLPAPRLGPILTIRRLAATERITREMWRLSIGDLELF